MRVTILDDYFDTLRRLPSFDLLAEHDVTVHNDHIDDLATLAERLASTEALVLIRERTPIVAALVDRLPKLSLISQRSVYPHIDIDACTRNGVLVCSDLHSDTPSYAAAELTWALILSSVRQISQQASSLRNGRWQIGVGKTLRGRRLGLYGYGRIAKTVAGYAEAFGMDVWWWASDDGRERARHDGVSLAPSREAFFADSDVVSVHVRLKPDTNSIITSADLAAMGPDSLFVNTSRSGLVEPGALEAAVVDGHPGNVAVDVFPVEPVLVTDDPFIANPNVLATPHIGYVTEDEWDLQFTDIYNQINAYAAGRPVNMVNPEAWPQSMT